IEVRRPLRLGPADRSWQAHAACADEDRELFFAPDGEHQAEREVRERTAKEVCASCPVFALCREAALDRPQRYGVWGGMGEEERMRERRNRTRRRGRPAGVAAGRPPTAGAARPPSDPGGLCGGRLRGDRRRTRRGGPRRSRERRRAIGAALECDARAAALLDQRGYDGAAVLAAVLTTDPSRLGPQRALRQDRLRNLLSGTAVAGEPRR